MKKAIKWVLIVFGGLVVLLIVALLLAPMFIDLQQYKPEIEKRVSEAVGRPFTLGGDLELSLFPWVGVSLSDIRLGNPEGFEEKDFASIKSFQVQVRLIPLLSKDVQVRHIRVESPRVVLIKRTDGQTTWEGLGGPPGKAPRPEGEKKPAPPGEPVALPIKTLHVGEISVTDGFALYHDQVKGERKEISDLSLRLRDVSLTDPIHIVFSAFLDGKPISVEGDVGPVGKEPGKGTLPMAMEIKALGQIALKLKGRVKDPVARPQFDLVLDVSPFSPRKLMDALGQPFPVKTADPEALDRLALKVRAAGDPKQVALTDGALRLDDSSLAFSAKAKDFSKPDLVFDLNLDQIDVDRYLPPPTEEKKEEKAAPPAEKKKMDYTPLRRLVMEGKIRVGRAKARGATIEDLYLKVTARDGLIHVDPLTLRLYEGDLSSKAALDVRGEVPKSRAELRTRGVQVYPLLKEVLNKDFLEGTVQSDVAIQMEGDEPERIKKTLNGKGSLLFTDGAIRGIDLTSMVQNVKSAFGAARKGDQVPRTDFSELSVPFTITHGVVDTRNTSMKGPLLRVTAAGKANLVDETLNFKVRPKFVATTKGQGDTSSRMGLTVPVIVSGTFASPKFRPDLSGVLKAVPDTQKLKESILGPAQEQEAEEPESVTDKVKGLFKSLPFGR